MSAGPKLHRTDHEKGARPLTRQNAYTLLHDMRMCMIISMVSAERFRQGDGAGFDAGMAEARRYFDKFDENMKALVFEGEDGSQGLG